MHINKMKITTLYRLSNQTPWYNCLKIKKCSTHNAHFLQSGFPRSEKVGNFVKAFPDREKVRKSAC